MTYNIRLIITHYITNIINKLFANKKADQLRELYWKELTNWMVKQTDTLHEIKKNTSQLYET